MNSPSSPSSFVRPGFILMAALLAGTTPARLAAQAGVHDLQDTIITSERLEMRNTGVEGHYVFSGNVRLTGTNLEITCDRLEVYSESRDDSDKKENLVASSGNIRLIRGVGNITVSQEGRRATAGHAEVLPREDRVILTQDPVVTDIATRVTMTGDSMTFYRGERYAVIENPRVVGPALQNLGFPKVQDQSVPPLEETPAPEPAPADPASPNP